MNQRRCFKATTTVPRRHRAEADVVELVPVRPSRRRDEAGAALSAAKAFLQRTEQWSR